MAKKKKDIVSEVSAKEEPKEQKEQKPVIEPPKKLSWRERRSK